MAPNPNTNSSEKRTDSWRRRLDSPVVDGSYGVVWEGSQFITHSLAIVNRELCSALIDRGVDLGITLYEEHDYDAGDDPRLQQLAARFQKAPVHPTAVHVRHQWPPDFSRPAAGKWVMIQPWEFGYVPAAWVPVMRDDVDEIWVPSRYARQCYIDSGVPAAKIQVIPNGVDTERFHPQTAPAVLQTKKSFKFLFVGGTIPRKGVKVLLETWRRTFTPEDDVCLVIKDMGKQGVYRGATLHEEVRALQDDPGVAEIEYIDYRLPHEQVAGLYTACDVLVHPYHGEGFGMPMAEAMSCGIPVIATGLGAALDFCNAGNSYLIPARRYDMPTREISGMEAAGFPWLADPNPSAFSALMKRCVDHPAERHALGLAARKTIVDAFTWKHAADLVEYRLQALASSGRRAAPTPTGAGCRASAVGELVQMARERETAGAVDEAADFFACALERAGNDPELVDEVMGFARRWNLHTPAR